MGTSAARSIKIDSTSPVVTKVKPVTLKPTSSIFVKFSEKVKGVSKTSVKLMKVLPTGKLKKVKAKISMDKKKTTLKVNPKGRLHPGGYQVLLNVARIRDVVGNPLAPSAVAPTLRPSFRVYAAPVGRVPQAGRDHRVPGSFGVMP